ncbi:hypothetical protein HZC07_04430 [Candidatus Micrarchaeota archaeon]|nr:hypothetical protein [Candidatus Micrarchaeota archaeon]
MANKRLSSTRVIPPNEIQNFNDAVLAVGGATLEEDGRTFSVSRTSSDPHHHSCRDLNIFCRYSSRMDHYDLRAMATYTPLRTSVQLSSSISSFLVLSAMQGKDISIRFSTHPDAVPVIGARIAVPDVADWLEFVELLYARTDSVLDAVHLLHSDPLICELLTNLAALERNLKALTSKEPEESLLGSIARHPSIEETRAAVFASSSAVSAILLSPRYCQALANHVADRE